MKTLSEHLSALTLQDSEDRHKKAAEGEVWLAELEAQDEELGRRPSNDEREDDRNTARNHIREGTANREGVLCDECRTELISTFQRNYILMCPGCGHIERDQHRFFTATLREPPGKTLKDSTQELIQLLAMVLSDPPVVLEHQEGRLVLELRDNISPFKPFDLKNLSFNLQQEGNRLTIELEGEPIEVPKENPTMWEHVNEPEPDGPEQPLCEICGENPKVLGLDRCKPCKDKKLLRMLLNR